MQEVKLLEKIFEVDESDENDENPLSKYEMINAELIGYCSDSD